jgi:hypothetical protein
MYVGVEQVYSNIWVMFSLIGLQTLLSCGLCVHVQFMVSSQSGGYVAVSKCCPGPVSLNDTQLAIETSLPSCLNVQTSKQVYSEIFKINKGYTVTMKNCT